MKPSDDLISALRTELETRGAQTKISKALEVSATTVMRWASGETAIPAAMQKLLRLYLFGEIPFGDVRAAEDTRSVLEFTPAEWRLICILAARAGQDPKMWIRAQIRAYLAFCIRTESSDPLDIYPTGYSPALNPVQSLKVAEDPGNPYGPRAAGNAKAGELSPSDSDEGAA